MEDTAGVLFLTRDDVKNNRTSLEALNVIDLKKMSSVIIHNTFLVLVVEGKRAKILKNRYTSRTGIVEDIEEFLTSVGVLEVVR